jgi:transketolase
MNKDINTIRLRRTILQMAYSGKSVHIGCAFSIVEIVQVIYSKLINQELLIRNDPNRDYVCLSKGHGVMAFYACLNQLGMIPNRDIENYFKDGSPLTGLSEANIPGIEVSGGSLGQGVTVSMGLALGKKLDHSPSKVFCIVGDGEINEGSAWETFLIAAHQKLSNFILIVDANCYQAMGTCESVLNLDPLVDKFKAFNFETEFCDGHDTKALEEKLSSLMKSSSPKPKVLIARTIKGKGVSFMENENSWHYSRLTEETFKAAMKELEK